MNRQCPGCKEPLRFWQRKGPPGNNGWHRRCSLSFGSGNSSATSHCTQQNEEHNLPSPDELYYANHSEIPELGDEYTQLVDDKLALLVR